MKIMDEKQIEELRKKSNKDLIINERVFLLELDLRRLQKIVSVIVASHTEPNTMEEK